MYLNEMTTKTFTVLELRLKIIGESCFCIWFLVAFFVWLFDWLSFFLETGPFYLVS